MARQYGLASRHWVPERQGYRMTVFNVISLLGGLALFLYGMIAMGAGLEKLAGGKAEGILRKMTSNPLKGVALGAVITAIIQSSSATTVIVIGLVNSGIMKFTQCVGVIMGANIGTTVTAQILRLSDISSDNPFLQILKPSTLAPAAAFIGIVLFMFLGKSAKKKNIGQILLGFGVLFTGMFAMEAAVAPLKESPLFIELFSGLTNPILGVLIGAGVTAAIQSSSASVGILQALTVTGAVTWGNAIPIILGQNIGTCITGVIAATGASRAAKRVAASHVYFNVIGTIIFMVAIYLIKGTIGFDSWAKSMNMGDVANFHTLFNVVMTILFLPFTKVLVRLSELTVPDKGGVYPELEITMLDERLYNSPSVAIGQARKAVEQMADVGRLVHRSAIDLLFHHEPEAYSLAQQREEVVDKLDVAISNYLVGMNDREMNEAEGRDVTTLLTFVTEYERIGDYAINIVERGGEVFDKDIRFSEEAQRELHILSDAVGEAIDLTTSAFVHDDIALAERVEPLEETVDAICEVLRERHIHRLKEGVCNIEAGIVFLEVLTDYERISDHCSNVATRLLSIEMDTDSHELRRALHGGGDPRYNEMLLSYRKKYIEPLSEDGNGQLTLAEAALAGEESRLEPK